MTIPRFDIFRIDKDGGLFFGSELLTTSWKRESLLLRTHLVQRTSFCLI